MLSATQQFVKNLQRFRLITFDVTDTLLQFKHDPAVQYAKSCKEFGVNNLNITSLQTSFREHFKIMQTDMPNFGRQAENMNWRKWWIELVERILSSQQVNISQTQKRQIACNLLEIYCTKDCWMYTEGCMDFLHKIVNTKKPLGVISNFDPRLLKVLDAMHIDKCFDFVINSYEAGVQKPDARIFDKALQYFAVSPAEALHIGNKYEIDYLGARNAGWNAVLLHKDSQKYKVSAPHTYANLKELSHALETEDIVW